MLPSFFEGCGLVIFEAMVCNLPAITTMAIAGPNVMSNREDGWVLEVGNDTALVTTLNYCLSNPERVLVAGRMTWRKAEQFSLVAYGDRWLRILDEVIQQHLPQSGAVPHARDT